MPFLSRLSNLLHARRHWSELDEELHFHLAMRSRDNQSSGMSPQEAERDARLRFGNLTLQKERTHDASILRWLESLLQDASYSLRVFRSSRAVYSVIILLLALGIGANTAIFSVTYAFLLRSLPVKDPAGLLNLRLGNFMSYGWIDLDQSLTWAQWNQLTRLQDVLSGAFPYAEGEYDVLVNGVTSAVPGALTTSQAFRTLGLQPAAGRVFGPNDEQSASSQPVVVISHQFWQRAFGGGPSAIGRSLLIEGKPFTVVGVTPARFFGLTAGRHADYYIPLALEPYLRGKDSAMPDLTHYWLMVFGRLRPGVTLDQARSRLAALSPLAMRATLPMELPKNVHPDYLRQAFVLQPAPSGLSYLRDTFKRPLFFLSALALLLLALALFTVANLLMARSAVRHKELAVRIALGASRGRIARQLAVEALLLAFTGATLGVCLSRALAASLGGAAIPVALDLPLDAAVFGFAFLTTLLCAVLFGLVPALRAVHTAPAEAFKGGSATVPLPVMRVRRALLVGQIAVTVVMLIGAALFATTLRNLMSADMGFNRHNVVLGDVDLRRSRLPQDARPAFYAHLLDRFRALPVVASASLFQVTPIAGNSFQFNIDIERPGQSGSPVFQPMHTFFNGISPEFFSTFETPVLAGRAFTAHDTLNAPSVVVVNTAFARAAFGKVPAIGRRVSLSYPAPHIAEIVGIVRDAKYKDVREAVPPTLYAPLAQNSEPPRGICFALRTRVPASHVVNDVSRILTREHPDLSFKLTTMEDQIDFSLSQERVLALFFALFGGLALCLAATGTYGVLAYFVEQRRPELGIRVALGATPANIRRMVYVQCLSALALGSACGCLFALWAARFIASVLYGVTPAQPHLYLAVIALVALLAWVSSLLPAIRASRAQTMPLLRCD